MFYWVTEQKNAMVSQLLEEEGFSRQTQDQDDLCVNKTVSSVVLALLVVGKLFHGDISRAGYFDVFRQSYMCCLLTYFLSYEQSP